MNGAVITLARWHARKEIKRQLYAQGIKLAHVEGLRDHHRSQSLHRRSPRDHHLRH